MSSPPHPVDAQSFPRPSDVEIMASTLLGTEPAAPPPEHADGRGVMAALERAMLPGLRRPPAIVSFSGGRDSSAVLATAVDVARRNGLPDPVPAIMRFATARETDETAWQELVLRHLEVARYEVVELEHELDALGPTATSALRRNGVRWPGNAYMHDPIIELARGGSLLSGVGGDELLGTRASRHVLLARRQARPRARDLATVPLALMPGSVRAAVWQRRNAPEHSWLTPAGADLVNRELALEEVAWPHRWDHSVAHWQRTRAYAAFRSALPAIAGDRDVLVVNPFLDRGVLAELAAEAGATGFPSRNEAMRRLFGALLPEATLARPTKAAFSSPVWGPRTRAFVADWRGEGLDAALIDTEALRREWSSREPSFRTVLLLHAAWLHRDLAG